MRPRRRAARRALLLAGLLLVGGASACVLVTQPVCGARDPGGHVTVDPARLESHVRKLAGEFSPRDHTHVENLDRAAAWIAAELRAAGGRVEEQPFPASGHTYRNIRAFFGPPTNTVQKRVVIGAHYDVCEPLPGADDNASGVAGLLELARLLGANPPPAPVELVAYSLEEPPHYATASMGSAVHAASLKLEGAAVQAMISIEMIGYFSDAPNSQSFPTSLLKLFYPTTGNFIAVIGRLGEGGLVRQVKRAMRGASPLPVRSMSAPRFVPGIDFSDHRNYWNHGYEAVMVTDTSFYRNANYHTAGDTPDTLDYRRMAQVVVGLDAAVRSLAEQ